MKINLDCKLTEDFEYIVYDTNSNKIISIATTLIDAWVGAADRLANILENKNISIEEYGIK